MNSFSKSYLFGGALTIAVAAVLLIPADHAAAQAQGPAAAANPFFLPAQPAVQSLQSQQSTAVTSSSAASSSSNSYEDDDDDDKHVTLVDDDAYECPDAAYTTIQMAIDSGAKRIRVCEGIYPENVVVPSGSNLELHGDGAYKTVVTGVAGTAGPIIDVLPGSKVEIESLAVDGGSVMAGGVVYGIRYTESNGEVSDVKVLNIRNANGSSQGVGIRVQSGGGVPAKVEVEDSLVQNYTRVGINGNGDGVKIEVSDNKVIGPVDPRVWAPNGIQIARGARGEVEDNTVDNNQSPVPPAGAGSGIILFCAGPTTVSDNKVTGADLGIAIADNANATVSKNKVHDSIFDGISFQFIGEFFGDLGCLLFPSPTTDNKVSKNKIKNSGDTGISFANFDANNPSPPDNNTVKKNKIEKSVNEGIHVFVGSDNDFNKNKIKKSGNLDIVDETSGGGTEGTANTWKKNKCNSSDPVGLC